MSYLEALTRMAAASPPAAAVTTVQPLEQTEINLVDPVQTSYESTPGLSVEQDPIAPMIPDPEVPRPPSSPPETKVASEAGFEKREVLETPPAPFEPGHEAKSPVDDSEADDGFPREQRKVVSAERDPSPSLADRQRSSPADDVVPIEGPVKKREDAADDPLEFAAHSATRLETALRVVRRWVEEPPVPDAAENLSANEEHIPQVSRVVRHTVDDARHPFSHQEEPVDLTIGTIHVTVAEPAKPRPEPYSLPPKDDPTVDPSDLRSDHPIDLARHYIKVR